MMTISETETRISPMIPRNDFNFFPELWFGKNFCGFENVPRGTFLND